MSGAVNPDSMLYAVTAALFYLLARAFRRGLTRTQAIALGALTAVGLDDEAQLRRRRAGGARSG